MNAEILDKKNGSHRQVEDTRIIVLDRPSVIVLRLAPENVTRYERRGDDLVLVLKDGQEILIQGFFVKYSEGESDTQADNVDAAESVSAEEARNELVLEDDNGVVWWGQYPEQWSEFHFTEIEWDDAAGVVWWPWLLAALGGAAAIGALAGGGGGGAKAHPPVAVDDLASGDEDGGPVTGNVLTNDTDPDNDTLSVSQFAVNGATYKAGDTATIAGVGTFTLNSDGSYSFTPAANWHGTVPTVTYTVSDGKGGSDTANLVITVNPVDDLTAVDDSATTDEDTPVSGTVATNDSTTSGGDLTFAKESDPSHGTVVVNPDGTYTYTPNANYNGPDSFTYTVTDADSGETLTRTVNITVNPVNDAPEITGSDQTGTVVEAGNLDDGSPFAGTPSASGSFAATDVEGNALTWTVLGTPDTTYGTFSIDPATGQWTYALDNSLPATQALNEGDSVPLTYTIQVSDGAGGTDTRTVTITITGTNDSPIANADTGAVTESGVLNGGNTGTAGTASATGNVLTNDTDIDDGETVSLAVSEVSFAGSTGAIGSALTGTYGSLVLNSDGSYTYTLDNDDADTQALKQGESATEVFTYTAVDVNGATSTNTLTITVTGTNDQPVITSTPGDAAGTVTEQGTTNPAESNTVTGTLAASDVDADATQTWSIAGTNGTYGTIGIDPVTGQWTYTLDNSRAATQALNGGDTGTETFTARVADEHGAYREQVITVTVNGSNDNITGLGNASIALTEDGGASGTLQDYVSDVDNTLLVTGFSVDADGDGTNEDYAPGDTVPLTDGDGNALGTLTIEENGDYSFTPAGDYAGDLPTVTYTMAESGGAAPPITQTIDFTIAKVADAPDLEADKTVNTSEDTPVSLGLIAPVITDTGTGTSNNDYPERIGAITLTIGGAGASGVTLTTGGTTLTPVGGEVTIVLTDVDHVTSVPAEDHGNGVYYLTKAQYEELVVNPPAESGQDFTVTVSATSYEVDGSGAIRAGVDGAVSTQVIDVDVQAVTDGATLNLDPAGADLTFAEEGTIDLSSYLTTTLTSTDANPGNDTDGSETYWYTVSGLPIGTVVTINGVATTISATVTSASSTASTSATPPTITIRPPAHYSGDIQDVTITLNSRDTDSDSSGTPATLSSTVTLDLHVTPIAGDVNAGNVTTNEDAAVAFLASVAVTDTGSGTTGTEVIDSVSFEVPAGWVVNPPASSAGWTYDLTGTTATIAFDNTLNEAAREAILDAFTIRPPAHSSTDETITLSITTTDSNSVSGSPASDTQTVARDVTITVNPIAEQVGNDSDGIGGNDVTMIGDHAYSVAGEEDTWFALGANYTEASNIGGGHDLMTGWSNADADEFTYAVLTPTLEADAPGDTVIGTQFRYSTDGGATWEVQTYVGEPIWVPADYLDTLQVKLPADVSGTLTIGVQTGTVDYDDDADITAAPLNPPQVSAPGVNVAVSGSATLSLIKFDPVADAVTMALNGRASGLEDTAIPLAIRATSSDSSETFNLTISGIPAGARIVYDGTELTVTGGSVTIANFSNSAPLTITPPLNSNDDFTLTVSAVSVDGSSTSAPVSRTIDVSVTGVADGTTISLPSPGYSTTEATLDANGNRVALSNMVTGVTSADNDGSEAVTLRITGLAEGFSLTGATSVVSGTGEERIWLVSANDLANVDILLPPNYSGTVTFQVAGVTTENDGDSFTGSLVNVLFEVAPSTESTITDTASLVEDQVTPLNLAIVHHNGDTDEVLGDVYVRTDYDTGTYTLHLNGTELSAAGLATATIGGVVYYVIPANELANLGAQGAANLDGNLGSLDFLYQVIDPSSDGSLPEADEIKNGTLTLTATPVTDAVDASITAIAMTTATGTTADATAGDDAVPDTATVTGSGTVTVNLHVDSFDSDGSEHLIRVLIDGVPDGVTVSGASQVGSGSWLLVYEGGDALSIGAGGIDVPVAFIIGNGAGNGTSAITMTVLAQDEGQSAATPAGVETDSVGWNLVLDLVDGEVAEPPVIDEWVYNGAAGTEDAPFTLGSVVDAAVSTSDTTAAYSYTVTVTDLPAGSTVNGMILTTINGVPTWTATVTVPAGGDSQAALDSLLEGISITPPLNGNDNNADFGFDAKLTASAVGGMSVEADTRADMPIVPVTDEATVTVAMDDVGEGETSVTAIITAADIADGVHGVIVDGKLYVQVSTNGNDGGTLTDGAGQTLALSPVSGVDGVPDGDYYVIDIGDAGGSVELTYTAQDGTVLEPGDVTFTAWVQTRETDAANTVPASASDTAEIVIVNNGVAVQTQAITRGETVSADKSNAIELSGLSAELVDNDGSETIHSTLLSGVPVGFLLYVGNNAGDATQASNAGGDGLTNTWVLSTNGTLPAYVAILPAINWSGTLDNLALIVESGENSLPTARVDTVSLETVTVEAVANGLTIDPTLSFGREGRIIALNLNAAMVDAVAATAMVPDDSTETTTLQIEGLGEYAAFYIGDDLVTAVSYNETTDTYTITGLSQDDLDDLGFVQSASALTDQDGAAGTQVTVTAWTVESGNGAVSSPVSDTLTLAVTPVSATTGNDSFIWGGQAINGRAGIDTVALRHGEDVTHGDLASQLRNVEILDLSAPGANSITGGLSIADVLAITGSNSGTLTINGDGEDAVVLSSASQWTMGVTTGSGHVTYTSTSGITLLIDEDVNVSYAA